MTVQPNPFEEFQSLLVYLGEVNSNMEGKKQEKDGYEQLLGTYVASFRQGAFDLKFYAVAQTLADQTAKLYNDAGSKGWISEAIEKAPSIYKGLNATLALYEILLNQRDNMLKGETAALSKSLQKYKAVISRILH